MDSNEAENNVHTTCLFSPEEEKRVFYELVSR